MWSHALQREKLARVEPLCVEVGERANLDSKLVVREVLRGQNNAVNNVLRAECRVHAVANRSPLVMLMTT